MANTIQPNNNTSLYNSTGNAIPTTGNLDANNINASGNVTVGGFIIANGSITTESNFVGNLVGNVTGNITLSGGNTEVIFNNNGVTGSSPDFTFDDATNELSVAGNVTANYYFGDGSQLTGLPATYGNANVADYLPTYSGNLAGGNLAITGAVSATGNITGNYIFGNGSQLTGLPENYSNANVAAYLPTYSGNLNPNTVSATGNVTALNLKTSGVTGNIVGANYVSANFYLGDGGLLSNIASTYGNANVAAYLPTYTGNLTAGNVSATGNITGSYFVGNGSQLTGLPAGYSNTDVNSHLAAFGSNVISTTGNVTAGYFLGDGSQLTNLPVQPGTYSNANVNAHLAAFGSNTITTTGNVTAGFFLGDGSQLTNLPVQPGTYSNANVNAHLAAFGSNTITTTGNITAANFIGNIAAANVVGTVANATYATSAGSATSATSAVTAGTVTGNAQANITSVGTLTALSVTGNTDSGNVTAVNAVTANTIQLRTTGNVTVATPGQMAWNADDETVDVAMENGVILQMGQELYYRIRASAPITAGQIVQFTGVSGENIQGAPANAASVGFQASYVMGVATQNFNTNDSGYITAFGKVRDLNTNAYPVGTILWLDPNTAGAWTSTEPAAPGPKVQVAAVLKQDTTEGILQVRVTANPRLQDIADVATSSAVLNDYLVYNGNIWQHQALDISTDTTPTLGGNLAAAGFSISNAANITITGIYSGNAAGLTNIPAANISGTVANAAYATAAGSATTATTANTVTDAAQPNITSLGNLSALSVTGTATVGNLATGGTVSATGNIITAGYFVGNFQGNITGNLTVPGSDTQVLYNANGNAQASGNFTYDYANNIMAVTGNINGGNISATGNVTGNYILGNGSQLTGLPATYSNADVNNHLAAFGSNVISTTGNVTAGYFAGNGSLLSNITAANVVGTVATANSATTATTAGTVTGNAQGNITSVGTLTSLSVSGNVDAGNINLTGVYYGSGAGLSSVNGANITGTVPLAAAANTANSATVAGTVTSNAQANITSVGTLTGLNVNGAVSATGNITGSYFIGNGSQLTGLPAGYSNTDVNNHLAAFGSNVITTTGNITAGNFLGNIAGTYVTGNVANADYATLAGDASTAASAGTANTVTGNAQGNITSVGTLTGLDVGGAISATGNITGNYFIGNGSQLTGIATTISGNLAGNLEGNGFGANALSFVNIAGNLVTTGLGTSNIGNLTIVTGNASTGNSIVISSVNSFQSNTTPNPGRINVGSGKNGDWTNTADLATNGRGARMWIMDEYIKYDTGTRTTELTVSSLANLAGGNIGTANANSRVTGIIAEQYVINGNSVNTNPFYARGFSSTLQVGQGANVGNATLAAGSAITGFLSTQAGSTANVMLGYGLPTTFNGNVTTLIGYTISAAGSANITTNMASFYHPGATATLSTLTTAAMARQATNYFAFRNDDTLAKSRLGSLETFNEFTSNVAISSGNITVDKNNGQVQQVFMTANVDNVTFSNFVTGASRPSGVIVNQSDTVTLIVQQGATPYNFTLPTGNANIRYAGGISSVEATANSTTMISITGVYNYNVSANQYLITVSPGFI